MADPRHAPPNPAAAAAAAEHELRARAAPEQKLHDQPRLLQHIVDVMGDGVVVADRAGRFILFNPAARAILGVDTPDAPPERWSEYFHFFLPDGKTPYLSYDLPLQRALRGVPSDNVEILVRNPRRIGDTWITSTARPLYDPRGDVCGGVTVIRDITHRRRADQVLRFQKSLLQAQGEASIDGILTVSETGQILSYNRRFVEMWRIPRHVLEAESSDQAALQYVTDSLVDPAGFLERVQHLYRNPTEKSHDELALKDGRTFDRYSAPILDPDGHLYGRVWFFRDVTNRKIVEEQLRDRERHYRDLADHNRRLAREVEHRVGNNLAALIGLVSAMRGRTPGVDAFADAIDTRLRAMARVHRLLATTGWDSVTLRQLVTSALELMHTMACHRADEHLDGPDDVLITPAQVLPLMQTLVELYTNSCKYGVHSHPGGRLRVTWQRLEDNPAAPRVRLRWQELDGPPIQPDPQPSLGTELITSFVTRELHGHATLRYPPTGADHLFEFPITPAP